MIAVVRALVFCLIPQVLSARKIPVADSLRNVFDVVFCVEFVRVHIRWPACFY